MESNEKREVLEMVKGMPKTAQIAFVAGHAVGKLEREIELKNENGDKPTR